MKLRLYHHRDGARVAYREAGIGPGLVLAHSATLTHREWEPLVEHLEHRFRVVLPDLPLHGDSEDRPRHPYTPEWMAEVLAAFCTETCGPRPLVGGHGLGAELLLRAATTSLLNPARMVLMPNKLHRPPQKSDRRSALRVLARGAAVPGIDRALAHAARLAFRPDRGMSLTARANPAARDLVRHAMADVGGNANLARSWAKFAARSRPTAQRDLLDTYGDLDFPVLLLWADQDEHHPLQGAEEELDLLPNAQLRVLPETGYLLAYDAPVGVAREIVSFCG